MPTRGTTGSAGYDLCCSTDFIVEPGERQLVSTGIRLKLPSPEYYGRIAGRSGLALRNGLSVLGGVIDSDYRGEVKVILQNHSGERFVGYMGDRIAQLIVERCCHFPMMVVPSLLADTRRGEGGFGSTGQSAL